ncbi:hypothetical protein [Luteipulveratus mongoliensis]|uniref:Uncharacterized protein n=1 Tax=Luteipulveratus mongoliensis TaxID=571913 RepID=A0A0K1JH08_9MICO|nr:hypothetical protein VV02_08395 [Luteipulveratus mongoliensis]
MWTAEAQAAPEVLLEEVDFESLEELDDVLVSDDEDEDEDEDEELDSEDDFLSDETLVVDEDDLPLLSLRLSLR